MEIVKKLRLYNSKYKIELVKMLFKKILGIMFLRGDTDFYRVVNGIMPQRYIKLLI